MSHNETGPELTTYTAQKLVVTVPTFHAFARYSEWLPGRPAGTRQPLSLWVASAHSWIGSGAVARTL